MVHEIHVTPADSGVWAVRDDDEGCLGFAVTEDQALRMGRTLADWFTRQGRPTELRVERSFAPADFSGGGRGSRTPPG